MTSLSWHLFTNDTVIGMLNKINESCYACIDIAYKQYMMTSSNENIFRVTGPLCGGFTGPGESPTQRPVTRSFGVFFDLRLNKRLSKQPWGWWFETLSWSLWRQCNELGLFVACEKWIILYKHAGKEYLILDFWEISKRLIDVTYSVKNLHALVSW